MAKVKGTDALSRKERFLIALKKHGFRTKALDEADIQWRTFKLWMKEDKAFSDAVSEIAEEVDQTFKEELESAGIARAISRSDGLLMFFLKSMDPKYKEKDGSGATLSVVVKENLDLGGL